MDFYKPKNCTTIVMEENNRYEIITAVYNVEDNINQSLLWNIDRNRPLDINVPITENGIYKFLKYFYPYYCQKLNVQD